MFHVEGVDGEAAVAAPSADAEPQAEAAAAGGKVVPEARPATPPEGIHDGHELARLSEGCSALGAAMESTRREPPAEQVEAKWSSRARRLVGWLIDWLGAPREELSAPWVRYLCVLNGWLALQQFQGEARDRLLFRTPSGERKVASYAVMNQKYAGLFRACLFAHIASGAASQLGSSLAIALEGRPAARWLALLAAAAETFCHAPTAFAMSPIVYGDKGVTPLLYGFVSFLLQLSGASALFEACGGAIGPSGERPELRRMCSTVSIFLYVRLYAIMRGVAGMLRKQKYSMAVMTAGAAMMPVGWQRFTFPAYFWVLMLYNRRTAARTLRLIFKRGIDGAAQRQPELA